MKCRYVLLLAVILLAISLVSRQAQAQPVSADTARVVAQNHVNRAIARWGTWGGAQQAQVADVQAIQRGGRDIGYYVTIQPDGYVVLFNNRRMQGQSM